MSNEENKDDLLSKYFADRLTKKHPQIVEMICLSIQGGMTIDQISQATASCANVPLRLAIIYIAKQLLREVK